MDTKHFKGNFPESCMVEGALLPPTVGSKEAMGMVETVQWQVLLPRTKLGADKCVAWLWGGVHGLRFVWWRHDGREGFRWEMF